MSCKQALKKMKHYSKPNSLLPLSLSEDNEPSLPTKPRIPTNIWEAEKGLDEWEERVPEGFSSPSKERFIRTVFEIRKGLARAALTELEYQLLHDKVALPNKRKTTSRRSLNLNSNTLARDALQKKKEKFEQDKTDRLRKAKKRLSNQVIVV